MENYKFKQLLQETATNYDGMSQELFKLSRRLEESPRYNPEHELYSLVRSSELNTLAVRSLAARAMGQSVSLKNPNGLKLPFLLFCPVAGRAMERFLLHAHFETA